METIFITPTAIERPAYYTKFYTQDGTYLRMDDVLSPLLLSSHPEVIKVELYKNNKAYKTNPTLIATMDQQGKITMPAPPNKAAVEAPANHSKPPCNFCFLTTIAPQYANTANINTA